MNVLKKVVKNFLHTAGFELRRHTTLANPAYQLLLGLNRFQVNLVFDVGSNAGQFARELREIGYEREIISFEPLSDAYGNLLKDAAKDANWHVHERTAVGDYDGEIEINIAGNSVSSSVLPMMEAHSSAAKNSAYIGTERVPICRLDSVAPEYLATASHYFVKIDTQGYESQVLDGAAKTLGGARGVLCELSLVSLYEGQQLWLEMIDRIESEGFVLWSLLKGFTDPRDGRTLQLNAVFFRE